MSSVAFLGSENAPKSLAAGASSGPHWERQNTLAPATGCDYKSVAYNEMQQQTEIRLK